MILESFGEYLIALFNKLEKIDFGQTLFTQMSLSHGSVLSRINFLTWFSFECHSVELIQQIESTRSRFDSTDLI